MLLFHISATVWLIVLDKSKMLSRMSVHIVTLTKRYVLGVLGIIVPLLW